jgi:hypothetical protein
MENLEGKTNGLLWQYLTLISEEAPQRDYSLRRIIRDGAQWRMIPNDLPSSFHAGLHVI